MHARTREFGGLQGVPRAQRPKPWKRSTKPMPRFA
jgi:hypothetical protein